MRMHALFNSSVRFSRALLLVGLILFSCVSAREAAAEIILQNDSIAPGVPLFVGGGYPASRFGNGFIVPVDGTIVGVQVWWGSPEGNTPPAQQPAIRISLGPLSNQMTTLAKIDSPTLIDGVLNEYRFTDPGTNSIPLSVPIAAGTLLFVDLEMANPTPAPDVANAPFILIDADRFSNPNALTNFFLPEGGQTWLPFTLGMPGAGGLGIRAIIQPVPEPSTYALAAMGVISLLAIKRRKAFRFSRALLVVGLILFSLASSRAIATEIVVKNDLLPTQAITATGMNFDSFGGHAAVRLTSPVDGSITGLQIYWGSLAGGSAPSASSDSNLRGQRSPAEQYGHLQSGHRAGHDSLAGAG